MSDRLLVLGWHNVEATWCFPSEAGSGERGLAHQLTTLARTTNVVDLADALSTMAAGEPLPPRAVALTFDDGYRDNAEIAAPMLTSLGLTATFFLVPGLLERSVSAWWEMLAYAIASTRASGVRWMREIFPLTRAARRASFDAMSRRLKRFDQEQRCAETAHLVSLLAPARAPDVSSLFLDWEQARFLVASGHAIGGHSNAHAILGNESEQDQRRDLAESKAQLERGLDTEVRVVAYPNGTPDSFDTTTERAAAAAGYLGALTTIPGWNNHTTPRFRLSRIVLQPERGAIGLARSIASAARYEGARDGPVRWLVDGGQQARHRPPPRRLTNGGPHS